jgi:sodium transport system permease protein
MRWSIILLIWVRELRDQLRDRRTVLMIVVLPVLLYPILGIGVLQLAVGFLKQQSVIGIYNSDYLHRRTVRSAGLPPRAQVPAVAWFAALPTASGGVAEGIAGAAAASHVGLMGLGTDYPPLVLFPENQTVGRFPEAYFDSPDEAGTIQVKDLGRIDLPEGKPITAESLGGYLAPLQNHEVDLILVIPPNFRSQVNRNQRPTLAVWGLENDDRSRVISNRVYNVLTHWKKLLKEVRLARSGLPPNFDDVFAIQDLERDKPAIKRATESLFDLMGKIFPFLLVMWSLAGALYPAVDLCAGEKERGTMETLLISPVSREEIVYGKFLAIWVFSAATALLNLLSMGITTWWFSGMLPEEVLHAAALAWCVLLVLPLSAFFSAICLAVGAYARSSKEGQYYLMPLFLITMPLIFLTLAPGVELNPFYSLVPVTGVALLLQKLMLGSAGALILFYFVPVLAPMVLYGWLALRWAVLQFQREEVLFREAERLDLGLWLQRLFREKEPTPSTGEGVFCFLLILVLRWLALGVGTGLPLAVRLGIAYLAFVLAPPVFMALLLTTRPLEGLGLRLPRWRAVLLAAGLAVVLLPPLGELTVYICQQFPNVQTLLKEGNPLTRELEALGKEPGAFGPWLVYLLVLGLLAPLSEELAFRGFILGALRRYFRSWAAILLSSFLFALYHANVFQFVPAFVLGVVLALFAVRTGSIVPGVVFHMLHNSLLLAVFWVERGPYGQEDVPGAAVVRSVVVGLCTVLSFIILWRIWHHPPVAPARADRPGPKEGALDALPADELVP